MVTATCLLLKKVFEKFLLSVPPPINMLSSYLMQGSIQFRKILCSLQMLLLTIEPIDGKNRLILSLTVEGLRIKKLIRTMRRVAAFRVTSPLETWVLNTPI